MASLGVIEPSTSEWAAPIVLIPKPDGSLRFCIEYRKLNEVTKRDSYPLPRMDDCLDSLWAATIFTTLDANSGYWQLEVADEDKDKTSLFHIWEHIDSLEWSSDSSMHLPHFNA
jgi:hypothetical protein